MDPIEKAEIVQNLKAYLIPSGMFLATVINAAGIFLIYNGYGVGWVLVGIAVTAIISALVAFAKLQNKHRAEGRMKERRDVRVSPPPVVAGQFEFGPDTNEDGEVRIIAKARTAAHETSETPEVSAQAESPQSEPAVVTAEASVRKGGSGV